MHAPVLTTVSEFVGQPHKSRMRQEQNKATAGK